MIDNRHEASGQRDAGDVPTPPLLHGVEPRPQWSGAADRLRGRQHQYPTQQTIAFLRDAAAPDPIATGADPRGQADVAGHLFGVGKAGDVAQFEDQHRGNEGADAGNRAQPPHARIVAPPLGDLAIQLADVRIE